MSVAEKSPQQRWEDYQAKQRAEHIARDKPIQAFANHHGWTDVYPCEVVRKISDTTVEIRGMKCTKKPWKQEWIAGGFFAHCPNQHQQEWEIEPDLEAPVTRIRWSKAKNRWQDKHGSRYIMASKPRKFYDYNF